MALNDNSQFNAGGLGENDNQSGWMRAIALGMMGLLPAGQAQLATNAPLPAGATQKNSSSGNQANAIATATLAAVASKWNYLTGFEVSGAGATAGAAVTVTITGLAGGALSYTYVFATGAAAGNAPLVVAFPQPLRASALNTAIVVSCPAGGAGNTNNTVNAHGFDATL